MDGIQQGTKGGSTSFVWRVLLLRANVCEALISVSDTTWNGEPRCTPKARRSRWCQRQ
ncbi:MAG TPA: hypothetical protein PK774_07820 [Bacteroidales bacterium]|nr:hypothetical protein [Bacteroidales bacterium]